MKKIFSLIIAVICMITTTGLTGCFRRENIVVDETKTQLSIYVYAGGLTGDWAKEVAKEFEEYYADYPGENGKKGVQVLIDSEDKKDPEPITTGLANGTFTWDIVYSDSPTWKKSFADTGETADITDVLTEKVYDENGEIGGSKYSILDKMDPYFVNSYDAGNGRYMAFPFQDAVIGYVYDADLFEEEGYEEPQTMEDFYTLLDDLTRNYIPIVYSNTSFYFPMITEGIAAQYGGQDFINLNKTYSGKHTVRSTGKTVDITPSNGYLIADSEPMYKALEFVHKILGSKSYYSSNSFLMSQEYRLAQGEYVLSVENAKRGKSKRIAMLFDGEWWEREAKKDFTDMSAYGEQYDYGKRNFKMLPFPIMEGQAESNKRYLAGWGNGTTAFITKRSPVKDLAKKWVQFQHSRSSLATFTRSTGTKLPYEYDLKPEEYESLTKFAQNMWNLRKDENVEIYRHTGGSEFRELCPKNVFGVIGAIVPSGYSQPMVAFRIDNETNTQLKIDTYYQAILNTFTKESWDKMYKEMCQLYGKTF